MFEESYPDEISHDRSATSPRLDSGEHGAGAVLSDGGRQEWGRTGHPAPSTSLDTETPGPAPALTPEQRRWLKEEISRRCRAEVGEEAEREFARQRFVQGFYHQCRCGRTHDSEFKFCRPCSRQKAWVKPEEARWRVLSDNREGKPFGHKKWPRDYSVDCGCTLERIPVPKGGARDRYPPDPACAACEGRGKIRDKHRYLKKGRKPKAAPDVSIEAGSYEDGISFAVASAYEGDAGAGEDVSQESERDFLTQGGWSIDTTAPEVPHRPGEKAPRGRPTEGIVDPELIRALFEQVLDEHIEWALSDEEPPYRTGGGNKRTAKSELDAYLVHKLVKGHDVNVEALAAVHVASKATVKRWVKRIEQEVSRNATKGEGNSEMSTAELVEIKAGLARIESKLEHKDAMDGLRWHKFFLEANSEMDASRDERAGSEPEVP